MANINICYGDLKGEKLSEMLSHSETLLSGQKCLHDVLAVNQRLDTRPLLPLMTASPLND